MLSHICASSSFKNEEGVTALVLELLNIGGAFSGGTKSRLANALLVTTKERTC